MINITLLSSPSNAIHDHRPRSSIPCCITLLAVFPKAMTAVPVKRKNHKEVESIDETITQAT